MRERYSTGWTDPRMPRFDASKYANQIRYSFDPRGYTVVRFNVTRPEPDQVLAHSLTFEEAEGFMKLLKEDDDG